MKSKIYVKTAQARKENSVFRKQRTNFSQSTNSPIDHILSLQRTIGNQAVQRLFESSAIQAKLKIGQPNDIYEQEADRVAEQVMSMPEPRLQRQAEEEELIQTKSLAEQITPLVQRQVEEEEEEELVQAKTIFEPIAPVVQRQAEEEEEQEEEILPKGRTRRTPEVIPDFEASIQALRDNGQPLSSPTRSFFEPRFGYDFSRVHIHNDARAAEIARAVNARAFTVGQDIAFGAGQYAPGTAAGRRLLAHELTHVLQQGNATAQRKLTTSKTNNFLERGANEVTSKITTGASHVQRQCTTAAGRVIFILYSPGIGSGCTYLRPGARVEFLNHDTVTHTIRIRPTGLFTSSSFLINAGAKVIVWVSRVSRVTGGSIIDNPGRRQTVHDVVVCP